MFGYKHLLSIIRETSKHKLSLINAEASDQPVSTMFAILAAVKAVEISFAFWLSSAFCNRENTVVFVGATNGVNLKIVLAPCKVLSFSVILHCLTLESIAQSLSELLYIPLELETCAQTLHKLFARFRMMVQSRLVWSCVRSLSSFPAWSLPLKVW